MPLVEPHTQACMVPRMASIPARMHLYLCHAAGQAILVTYRRKLDDEPIQAW